MNTCLRATTGVVALFAFFAIAQDTDDRLSDVGAFVNEWLVHLSEQVEEAPDDHALRSERGQFYLNSGDALNALVDFEVASELAPDNALYHCQVADALRVAGEVENALQRIESGLTLSPDFGPCLFVKARCLAAAGNLGTV